jgi:hypothetical protein
LNQPRHVSEIIGPDAVAFVMLHADQLRANVHILRPRRMTLLDVPVQTAKTNGDEK